MDKDELKDFVKGMVEVMREGDLEEIEYEEAGIRVKVRRAGQKERVETLVTTPMLQMDTSSKPEAGPLAPKAEPADRQGLVEITSPMVGTFYEAPSPEADPYVRIEDVVDDNTVICIIEAMKVMNEIKAEVEGKIVEILVENGQVVEYGQPLFLVDPKG